MVQPILTACSFTVGWEMLFWWLFVTFIEDLPKRQAIYWLHFPFYANHPMRVTAEKLFWVDFLSQTDSLQISISSVYSYNNVCRDISSSKVDLEQEGFVHSEENMVLKYLKVLLLMCWSIVVSLLWMILLQQGTSCQYTSLYKLLKQQHCLCFPQLRKSRHISWESLTALAFELFVRLGCCLQKNSICAGLSQHLNWS